MGLPTPEELGERIERGELSEAEAVEIMAERMRRQALPFLCVQEPEEEALAQARKGLPKLAAALALAVAAVALCVLLWFA